MAKKSATYIVPRGNMFQYRRRVPQAVIDQAEAWQRYFGGKRFYRVSLKTGDYACALEQGAETQRLFEEMVSLATRHQPLVQIRVAQAPTATDLGAVAQEIRDSIVKSWRNSIKSAGVNAVAAAALHIKIENEIEEYRPVDPGAGPSEHEIEYARQYNREWGFNVDEGSDDFGELILAVRDGRTQGRRDANDLIGGKSLPDAVSSTLISSFGRKAASSAPQYKFSEVVSEQRRVSNFSKKTLQKADRAQRLFIQLIGDKPVDLIIAEDIHRFIDALAMQEVGKTGKRVTRATVQSYVTQISSPLLYAVQRRWLVHNPAAGHNIKHFVAPSDPVATPPKKPFTAAELNKVFSYFWFTGCKSASQSHAPGSELLNDMRYWAPVLALYTGARAAELGGLKLNEIILGAAPHFLIQPNEFRRTKSGKSRIVPMLDALIELGFLTYLDRIKASGSDRLFPDWKCPAERGGTTEEEQTRWSNSKWIRSFNRTVIPQVVPPQNAQAQRSAVTFHSFRGSFKSLLIRSGTEKMANAIIGHTETALDKAYLISVTPEDLHREFRNASYEGLVLSTRNA
ncbi:hypothetical protein EUU23_12290 [Sphingorhabdus sp. IMCC26285]|uniref:Tyr recombinase domain-containing protein n=1 Tax=Sphingorhabdus profundilacus TaxID=2509718 RepID=A0A6I4M2B3_9SPHN|nr:tyrosine-type recombinase/integrase [Sphingorhabdus profundilacus]MVZ98473.1 hypothetical protein [Sphingorhabdus profundilacus]